jgi:hypothetical protein
MQKVKSHIRFVGFGIVVCAFGLLNFVGQNILASVSPFDASDVAFVGLLIGSLIIGLIIGALSRSARLACWAGMISIAIGMIAYGFFYNPSFLINIIYFIGGFYWHFAQLAVGGISGLIGFQLKVMLTDFWRLRATIQKAKHPTESSQESTITPAAFRRTVIYILIVFFIIFGQEMITYKIILDNEAGQLRKFELENRLDYRVLMWEKSAQGLYEFQKDHPKEADRFTAYKLGSLNLIKQDEKHYLLSHPKEYPNAYRMFGADLKKEIRVQNETLPSNKPGPSKPKPSRPAGPPATSKARYLPLSRIVRGN